MVVLISGGGSNLQALIDACGDGRLGARVLAVVSNRREAFGLQRAAAAGIPAVYAPLGPFRELGRPAYDADLADRVARFDPALVVCAGWMHVLSPAFLDRFPGRVINLHPALPGELPGVDAIARAWREGALGRQRSGVMVHHVVPEIDAGPVIAVEEVPLRAGEPLEDFAARMHAVEHRLLVSAVHRVLEGG